jgi:hypothetical protein
MAGEYTVTCECGRPMAVTAAEAGATRACPCGRSVSVPSLRALKRSAGEAAVVSPELVLKAMVQQGRMPDGDDCVECYSRTDHLAHVRVECEKRIVRRESRDDMSLGLSVLLFGWLAALPWFRRTNEVRSYGRDLTFVLPIRLCERCARDLRGPALARAVRRVEDYSRLLDQFPQATVSPSPGPAGVTEDV